MQKLSSELIYTVVLCICLYRLQYMWYGVQFSFPWENKDWVFGMLTCCLLCMMYCGNSLQIVKAE